MIVGYHVIFGMYGFWLPNDPRGSWSDFVGSWNLFRYGPATKTSERCSLAYRVHDVELRRETKKALKYPAVQLSGLQARAVARGFAGYLRKHNLRVYACAILPDHTHMVIGRPHIAVERLVIQLKAEATRQLVREQIHPLTEWVRVSGRPPKCFSRGEWKVFLDPEDVPRAIEYVEENPVKEGKRKQNWRFVNRLC